MLRVSLGAAILAALSLGMANPALAQDTCMTTATQLQTLATAETDASAAKEAMRRVDTGARLCAAGNDRAARKEFRRAMKALDVTEEQLAQAAN